MRSLFLQFAKPGIKRFTDRYIFLLIEHAVVEIIEIEVIVILKFIEFFFHLADDRRSLFFYLRKRILALFFQIIGDHRIIGFHIVESLRRLVTEIYHLAVIFNQFDGALRAQSRDDRYQSDPRNEYDSQDSHIDRKIHHRAVVLFLRES